MTFVFVPLALVGLGLCLVTLLLLAEIGLHALDRHLPPDAPIGATPRYVVLIPAYNESQHIGETVRQVRRQVADAQRVLVVADNCDDDTARLAREAGAEVVERQDPTLQAKGYALAHGIAHLRSAPTEVVIVLDADCRANDGALDLLARKAAACMRPVQSVFLMKPPAGAGLRLRMAAFAWAVRNHLRPAGLARLSLPCQLTGSGMAFPWPLLQRVDFATGHLVEDLHLGLQFARNGSAPLLEPAAIVTSQFAESREGQESQRRRWEHGQLELMVRQVPALLWEALRSRNGALLALACDLCVPPLALLTLCIAGYGVLGTAAAVWDPVGVPLAILGLIAACAFSLAVAIGWHVEGRSWVSAGELALSPLYALRKLPLYLAFLTTPQRVWTRTKRGR